MAKQALVEAKEGSIVTITDPDCFGHDGQAIVVATRDDDPDGYNFRLQLKGKAADDLPHPLRGETEWDMRWYRREEFRVDDGWRLETRAEMVFKKRYHHLMGLKEPLDHRKSCMADNCTGRRQHRVLVNCWGTVMDVDVCDDCKPKWDGKYADMFPFKKELCQ